MKNIFTFFMLLGSISAFCQMGGMSVSPTGSPPAASAALDINFKNKGFLMPRLTQGQRDSISAPDFGLMIINSTSNCVEMYAFGYWQSISCLCSGPPSTPDTISGNGNPCANSTNIIYSVPPCAP